MPVSEKKEDMPVISYPPHIRSGESVPKIMWSVVIALLPAAAFSVYLFGPHAAILMGTGVCSAVIAEAVIRLLLGKKFTVTDGSAVVTGLLLGMNVPPLTPWWMVAIGSFFAIIIVKQLFGGLGFNIFNPALAARAFLMASWPAHMTMNWHHFGGMNILSSSAANPSGFPPAVYDTLTRATPLTLLREGPKILADNHIELSRLNDMLLSPDMLRSLFLGNVGGCVGETSALLLLAGALFLLIRKIITWRIPFSFIGTTAAAAAGYYYMTGSPAPHMMALYHVLSGGLILGACFMATDMVTSPVSGRGMLIFGAGCGLITFVIRIWGGYPEGVSYAILIMNAFVPLIDRLIKPKVFGAVKKSAGAGA
jgi:Na+-translocating ferredoxin:NAD+ oxidoreductase subunit D